MSVAQATNLSLLSRGVGEVQHGGHEKIEVKLEPEDYNNWLDDSRRVWNVPAVLPPIQQSSHPPQFHSQHGGSGDSTARDPAESDTHRSKSYQTASHDSALPQVYLPKTFTTRKGALLLFSEDFANKHLSSKALPGIEKQDGDSAPELRTVDDLAKSILAYGATNSFSYNQEQSKGDVYLGFVHTRTRKYYERQCKPGFSAKRYLSSWSKLWDFSLLDKLTTKGYIKPVPYQKKSDYDVSGIPLPYRILRQWLFAPGSIDGYTFYRQGKLQTSREPTVVVVEETPRPISVESEISDGSIKVTSLLANKELNYGELDSTTKESILTELLVKSAITHAIKKQKEYQEAVTKHLEDEEEKRKASAKLYEFDMMNAIQTALDSTAIPTVSTFNLDPQGLIPSKAKTKKEKKGFRGTKGFGLQVSTTTSSSVGSATSMRSSFDQKHKVLPPIQHEEQKISKPITIGGQIPTVPVHYDAPPATVTEVDEEYVNWRQTVLSNDKQIADNSSGLSKQKSVSKLSLDAGVELNELPNHLQLISNSANVVSNASHSVIDVDTEAMSTENEDEEKDPEKDSVISDSLTSNMTQGTDVSMQRKSVLASSGNHFSIAIEALSVPSGAGAINTPSSHASIGGTHLDVPEYLGYFRDARRKTSSTKLSARSHLSKVLSHSDVSSTGDSAMESGSQNKSPSQRLSVSLNDLHEIDEVASAQHVTGSLDNIASDQSARASRATHQSASQQSGVSSIDLLAQVGLENDHDMDDKKSVISTMSLLSMTSKRSKFSSAAGVEAPYTKGITSRQDPTMSLLKVDMTGDESDPAAAITSWKYKAEEEEPVAVEEVVEMRREVTPVLEEAEESVSSVRLPEVQAPPTPPNSVPSAADCTPTPLPTPLPPTPPEEPTQLTENEFMEVLTEQAREIAKAVLEQNPQAGLDLATDAKNAAELLMNNLPDGETTATNSRADSQSADVVDQEPPVPQINKDLWKMKLSSEVQDGEAAEVVKADVGDVTVGQLVKEGLENLVHKIDEYVTADGTKTEGSSAHTPSIASGPASVPGTEAHTPSVKSSRLSSAQLDAGSAAGDDWNSVPSAQGMTPAESRLTRVSGRSPSSTTETVHGGSRAESVSVSKLTSRKSSAAGDVLTGELADGTYSVASAEEASTPKRSTHSMTPRKSAGKVKHETEFVVGKVADKTELQQLYAPIDPPSPPKSKPKGGKAKPIVPKPSPPKKDPSKKVEKGGKKMTKKAARKDKKTKQPAITHGSDVSPSEKTVSPVPTPKQPSPVAPKEPTPEPELEEWKTPEPVEEPEMEFVIVREEFSDDEEKPQLGSVKSLNFASESPEPSISASSTQDEEFEIPPGLSNRDAQAAKRAAAKERRRKEVEKRRREREEALRKEKEDAERKERIRIQMEEERQRREEEIKKRKEMEKLEQERLEREEEARLKAERDAQERERRRQEERARYLEEKKKRALEEEQRRKELQAQREAEEAERRRLEEEMLKAMAEEERAEYLRRKEEEERLQRIAEEEARIRREEENRRMREELQRQEMERRRAEEILRQRLMFQRSLNVEAHGMDHSQDITRAFVFSYYELLKWLGYEVPEWAQYGPAPSADFVYNNHPNDSQQPNDTSNQHHAEH